jgi:hypothetical protein
VTQEHTSRRWWLLLALAALAQAVAVVVTPHALPIYYGIGFPDEPYRFVDPPPDYRDTKAPTTATATIPVAGGRSTGGHTVASGEVGPQISLVIFGGALETDADVTTARVIAVPVALTGGPPPGHVWSNVYRVTFDTAAGPARLAAGTDSEIRMRAPSPQQPGPTFYVRHGDSDWRALDTQQPGRDIYRAELAGAGDYVLAGEDPLDVRAKDPNSEAAVGWAGLALSAVLVGLVIVLFVRAERRRSRRRAH